MRCDAAPKEGIDRPAGTLVASVPHTRPGQKTTAGRVVQGGNRGELWELTRANSLESPPPGGAAILDSCYISCRHPPLSSPESQTAPLSRRAGSASMAWRGSRRELPEHQTGTVQGGGRAITPHAENRWIRGRRGRPWAQGRDGCVVCGRHVTCSCLSLVCASARRQQPPAGVECLFARLSLSVSKSGRVGNRIVVSWTMSLAPLSFFTRGVRRRQGRGSGAVEDYVVIDGGRGAEKEVLQAVVVGG